MRCARSTRRRRAGRGRCSIRRDCSAISIATSCIGCWAASTASTFRRPIARDPRAIDRCSRRAGSACRHRRRLALSDHRPAARLACRRRACQDRRCARRSALSRREAGAGFLRLALRRLRRAPTACSANTGSSSSMASPMPATWRSPIAGTSGISTPAWRSARSKRREEADLHADLRHRLRARATSRADRAWPSASASIISPSTAPRTRTASS